ncbi:MAG: beta-ketoacyl-[acyl-carrier-protein] synthase family protein [Planctomycetota bacterium]
MSFSDRRVVITGMGLISPLGHSSNQLWEALTNQRSGVSQLDAIPTEHLPTDIGGQCREFQGAIDDFGELDKQLKRQIKRGLKLMCRDIKLGVAAAQLAINDAGLTPDNYDPARFGTVFGSDYIITVPNDYASGIQQCLDEDHQFQFSDWAEKGLTEVEPLWLLKYLPNMPASHVAIFNNLQGPSNSITVREASANLAVAEAATIIARGSADRMVAGATGSRIHPLRTVHLVLQEQLANRNSDAADGDPTKACRPFDKDRNGMVLGEGAGVMILEELSVAQERGADILAEIIGYGSSAVASPEGEPDYQTAFENVLLGALETSGCDANSIGHVHAHGLSSPRLDRDEAVAIEKIVGACPVTAAKSYMGNLGSGGGMIEMISSILAVKNDSLFPILNCDALDSECPINAVTEPQSAGNSFINLNITPQGQASSVIVRKWEA